jgi:flavin reductase (DIM6/NTAB) family NADH-FMN oxidoreductase RutF
MGTTKMIPGENIMKKKIGPKALIMPMPALLVGTYSGNDIPNAMTAAWTAVCCHKPLAVGVAIRHNRLTFQNLQKKKAFTLNVPSIGMATEVDYVGTVSGEHEPKKLEIADLRTEKSATVDAPIITACPINIECELMDRMVLGSHSWFVGEVKEVQVDESCLLDNGQLILSKINPLIYIPSSSQYYSVGDIVGQAFNMGKKLTRH